MEGGTPSPRITAQPLGGLWLSIRAEPNSPGPWQLADYIFALEFPESVRFRKSATPRNRPLELGMLAGVAVGATVHAACRPKGY